MQIGESCLLSFQVLRIILTVQGAVNYGRIMPARALGPVGLGFRDKNASIRSECWYQFRCRP